MSIRIQGSQSVSDTINSCRETHLGGDGKERRDTENHGKGRAGNVSHDSAAGSTVARSLNSSVCRRANTGRRLAVCTATVSRVDPHGELSIDNQELTGEISTACLLDVLLSVRVKDTRVLLIDDVEGLLGAVGALNGGGNGWRDRAALDVTKKGFEGVQRERAVGRLIALECLRGAQGVIRITTV